MTEPKEIADHLEQVEDGLFHWRIHNSGIGGNVSSSQALVRDADCVFVDPVRLEDDLLATLPTPRAVALTARCHQRAAVVRLVGAVLAEQNDDWADAGRRYFSLEAIAKTMALGSPEPILEVPMIPARASRDEDDPTVGLVHHLTGRGRAEVLTD